MTPDETLDYDPDYELLDPCRDLNLPTAGHDYDPAETEFMSRAACRGYDPGIFDLSTKKGHDAIRGTVVIFGRKAAKKDAVALARQICYGCPVLDECRAFITKYPEPEGIWAGQTPSERGHAREGSYF